MIDKMEVMKMNKSYKFCQVGNIEKSSSGDIKVVFENAMYRVVKTVETVHHGNVSLDVTNYNVRKKKEERGISDVYIQSDWGVKDVSYTVKVTTTSFGGCDLDFVEQYANNLLFAVKSARELEKMLKDGTL